MVRLPVAGSDDGVWGDILNDFLLVGHNADGTLKDVARPGDLTAKADDVAVVHLSGAETISGAKVFSASPQVPAPTTAADVANKTYVDATVETMTADLAVSTSGVAATQTFLSRIKRGVEDASLLVVGDSTGNDPSDWVRLFATRLGADWPTHTVEYRLWDDSTTTYAAASTVSTGSGSRKITIYNMSVAGWMSVHVLGAKFAPGIRDVQPNLCVINLGHNETLSAGKGLFARFANLTESITAACPFTDMILVAQNPTQTNTTQAIRTTVIQELCALKGYGFIDVHQYFIDAGIPAGWFSDSVHPNATGSAEWAAVVAKHFRYDPSITPLPRQASSYTSAPASNLILNGNFAGYTTGTPASWTATNVTATKDTTLYDSAQGYSLRLQSASAASALLNQYVTTPVLTMVRGQYLTLAVRIYIPAGSAGTHGRIAIAIGGGTSVTSEAFTAGYTAWKWVTVTAYVAAAATYVNVIVYADSSTTGTGDVRIDRVVLSRGVLPRDMLMQ